MNLNLVALIHKFKCADRISDFRSIALANFQFKIITKVFADRLALIAPKIISDLQKGFIKGRRIADCLCIALEGINVLDSRSYDGNIAMKFDIKKAFYTIDWIFLLKVLKAFGFNDVFCKRISKILHSAKLSFNINGHYVGYMSCKRGVRQGDPLSPPYFVWLKMSLVESYPCWWKQGNCS